MAKQKVVLEKVDLELDKEVKVKKSDRELRWELLQENYAKVNPAKYEAKKAAGHFDKIPESFQ